MVCYNSIRDSQAAQKALANVVIRSLENADVQPQQNATGSRADSLFAAPARHMSIRRVPHARGLG